MSPREISLDDPAAIANADPGGMLRVAGELGDQLLEGFRSAAATSGLPAGEGVRSVVMCGMGGSGVAGDIFQALYEDRLPVPIVVTKGYSLPEFARRETLVVAASFSGNTEETLAVYTEALSRGCRLVTVSAGGELAERSGEHDVAHVSIPGNVPVPRAALGYLAAAPIGIMQAMELIPPADEDVAGASSTLRDLGLELDPGRPTPSNEAKKTALWADGRTIVVWGSEGASEAAALRWKTQVNENAKVPAFHSSLPELDHNEVEGWSAGTGKPFGLVVLRHHEENPRVADRVKATLEAIEGAGLETREVWGRGTSALELLLSLVMVGDFTSAYLAILRGQDPTPIPTLTGLKERLRDVGR